MPLVAVFEAVVSGNYSNSEVYVQLQTIS